MHISSIYIDETISRMSAPVAEQAPAAFPTHPAPSHVEDDAAAWDAWTRETFTDLPPAPAAPPTDPTAAAWDAWRRSTFTELNR